MARHDRVFRLDIRSFDRAAAAATGASDIDAGSTFG
jgi:hypothetical protein